MLLRGSTDETAIPILVETLSSLGKLKVNWSVAATQRVKERKARIAIDAMPLLHAIHAVVDSYGVVCHVKGLVLEATTEEETPKAVVAEWAQGAARQMCSGRRCSLIRIILCCHGVSAAWQR